MCCLAADFQPDGGLPVSASAIPISEEFEVYTPKVRGSSKQSLCLVDVRRLYHTKRGLAYSSTMD